MAELRDLHSIGNPKPTLEMAADILGCKWSLTVIQLVRQGICRPGIMQRSVDGLTTKVLNERLRKLVRYKIFQRHAYPEIPPRVEYQLTAFGEKFVEVLDKFSELDDAYELAANANDSLLPAISTSDN